MASQSQSQSRTRQTSTRATGSKLRGQGPSEEGPVLTLDDQSLAYLRHLALRVDGLKAGVVLVTRETSLNHCRGTQPPRVPFAAGGVVPEGSVKTTIQVALGTIEDGHRGVATRLGIYRPRASGRVIEGSNFHIEGEGVVVEGCSTTFGEVTAATLGDGRVGLQKLSAFLGEFWRRLRS